MSQHQANVQVYIRVRPNKDRRNAVECVGEKEVSVKEKCGMKCHTFNKVFDPNTDQVTVYENVVRPLIGDVFAGYSCTVFAYGQSGSGKTYTMRGEKSGANNLSWENGPKSGLIPRSLSQIFNELGSLPNDCSVQLSFIEIYNEELLDLLSSNEDSKLRLYEDTTKKGSVIISGVEEVLVRNESEALKIMEKGFMKQQVIAALRNEAHSSHSHTVFSVTVHIKENSIPGEEYVNIGKLCLVDLSGSENSSRVNLSLLTLGRVIQSLVTHNQHIPYRESKLTRMLQDSLGGSTKTSIIATVYPSSADVDETLNTLDCMNKAKYIVNCPQVSKKFIQENLMKKYREEIVRLRKDLEANREKTGFFIDQENYMEMEDKIVAQEQDVLNLLKELKDLKEDSRKKEIEATKRIDSLEADLQEKAALLQLAEAKCLQQEQSCNKTKDLLATSNSLLRKSILQCNVFAGKLKTIREVESANKMLTANFKRKYLNTVTKSCNALKQYTDVRLSVIESLKSSVVSARDRKTELLQSINCSTNSVREQIERMVAVSQTQFQDMSAKMNYCSEKLNNWQIIETLSRTANLESNEENQFMKNVLLPELEDGLKLKQKMAEQISKISELQTILSSSLCRLANTNTESFVELGHVIVQMKNDIESQLSHMFTCMQDDTASLQKHQSDRVKEMEAYISQLEQSHTKSAQLLSDETTKCLIHNLNLAEVCNQNKNIMRNTEENLSKTVNSLTVNVEMMRAFQEGYRDNTSTCLQNTREHFQANKENLNRFTISLNTHKKHATETHSLETCVAVLKKEEKSFRKTLDAVLKDQTNKFKEEDILVISKQTLNMVESRLLNDKHNIHEKLKEIQDCDANLEMQKERMNNNLEDQLELHESLLKKELKNDLPTGETPQRQEYKYPQDLAVTSPHERLKERFRSNITELVQETSEHEVL